MCFNEIIYSLKLPSPGSDFLNYPRASGRSAPGSPEPTIDLSHCSNTFEKDTELVLSEPGKRDFLGLYFNLGPDIDFNFMRNGLPPRTLERNHYYFMYLPKRDLRYVVHAGKATAFSIHFPLQFLQSFHLDFPVIKKIIRQVEQKKAWITDTQIMISTDMMNHIKNMLGNRYATGVRDGYLISVIMDVFVLFAEQLTLIEQQQGTGPDRVEQQKAGEAARQLASNMQEHWTLDRLADTCNLEKRTLTRLFRKVHHKSVMEYLFDVRMSKAVELLKNHTIPLSQIATAVGFKSPSNFSEAFRRKFGHAPRDLRQQADKS